MIFDKNRLQLLSLNERVHDLDVPVVKKLAEHSFSHPYLRDISFTVKKAKETGSSVIMMLGGHVIRSGVQRYIIDMMEKGYITCLAMNGSGVSPLVYDFYAAYSILVLTFMKFSAI